MSPIIGIDPGLGGAIALVEGSSVQVHDLPIFNLSRNGKAKREVDLYGLARLIDALSAGRTIPVYIEQVGAMPGQGVTSMFAFGKAYGAVLGVCAAHFLPIELVTPAVWKRSLGVSKDKDASRAKASSLFPTFSGQWSRAKDDGRAEAVLLAHYGVLQPRAEAA